MFENILKEFEHVKGKGKIILFGSFTQGNPRFDSDIDIAVISDDKGFIRKVEGLANRILFEYGRVVSLVKFGRDEFSREKEPIIKEIKKGRVLYEGNS